MEFSFLSKSQVVSFEANHNMLFSTILAIYLAAPVSAFSFNDLTKGTRKDAELLRLHPTDDNPWPEASVKECSMDGKWVTDRVVLKKDEKVGACINSLDRINGMIRIPPDGVMCDYWDAKDCKGSGPDKPLTRTHLGPYGGKDIQAGTGEYHDGTYRSGTFPMWDPRSYKCQRITFNSQPATVMYCLYGQNCRPAKDYDFFG